MSRRVTCRATPRGHPEPGARRALVHAICLSLLLAPAVPPSLNAQAPRGTITGVVRDSMGGVVSGAEIRVESSSLRSVSDVAGRYRLTNVPAGDARLTIRRLGFKPTAMDLEVAGTGETRIDIELAAMALQLAPVTVSERREVFDARLAGFNARRTKGAGHFITRDRIEQSRLIRMSDVMRTVPGVRVIATSGVGQRLVRLRGATCPPLVFVDGFPATAGEFDMDMIDPSSVEGVEIYGGTSSVPPELLGPRGLDRCGVIAIWSRPARPRTAREKRANRGEGATPQDLGQLLSREEAFTVERVDESATLQQNTGIPAYPDSLWQKKVAGRAVLEFVVDTTGAVEMGTVGIVSATHLAFAESARDALRTARFSPAVINGRHVRQVVLLPFEFDPDRVRYVLPDTTVGRGVPLADPRSTESGKP